MSDLVAIQQAHQKLSQHTVYRELSDLDSLRVFMQSHIFAVWDFMSLLKTLQRGLTCVEVPWRPAKVNPKITRMINEIVLGEESDLDPDGQPLDHFTLYCQAMDEVGASRESLERFLLKYDFSVLPPAVAAFLRFNLNLCFERPLEEVAAAFFFGREKLIPDMFSGLLDSLKQNELSCPKLLYYIERHIELDGGEHGQLAQDCLALLTDDDPSKLARAYEVGLMSLQLRHQVWDEVHELIERARSRAL